MIINLKTQILFEISLFDVEQLLIAARTAGLREVFGQLGNDDTQILFILGDPNGKVH